MKTFGILAILSLTVIAVALQTRANPNPPISAPQKYGDGDACDVYSAVLPMDESYWRNSKTLLIVQEIPPSEWPIGSPKGALQGSAEFSEAFAGVFKSFEAANQQEMLLECDFTIQSHTRWSARPNYPQLSDTFRQTQSVMAGFSGQLPRL